jgi:hypothetical protein
MGPHPWDTGSFWHFKTGASRDRVSGEEDPCGRSSRLLTCERRQVPDFLSLRGGALGSDFHRPGNRCVGNEGGPDAAVLSDRELDRSSSLRLCGAWRRDGEMQDRRSEASWGALHTPRINHHLERLNGGSLLFENRDDVGGCTGCYGCEQHIKRTGCSRCITIDTNLGAMRSPSLERKATDPVHFNRCRVRDSR